MPRASTKKIISNGMRKKNPSVQRSLQQSTKKARDEEGTIPPVAQGKTSAKAEDDVTLNEKTLNKLHAFRLNAAMSTRLGSECHEKSVVAMIPVLAPVIPVTSMDAVQAHKQSSYPVYERSSQPITPLPTVSMPLLANTTSDPFPLGLKSASILRAYRPHEAAQSTNSTDRNANTSYLLTGTSGCQPLREEEYTFPPPTTGTALSIILETPEEASGVVDERSSRTMSQPPSSQEIPDDLKDRQNSDEFEDPDIDIADDDLLKFVDQAVPLHDLLVRPDMRKGASGLAPPQQLPCLFPSSDVVDPTPRPGSPTIGEERTTAMANSSDWMMVDDESEVASVDLTREPVSGSISFATIPQDPAPAASSQAKCIVLDEHGARAISPIARPLFPRPVRDRSLILGVTPINALRTCFRIGEALNVGCQAVRTNRPITIELYARVETSWRDTTGSSQHFVLSDLFHDRPPFINGLYDVQKDLELWDYDSSRFLEQASCKRLCRCIGRMKREEQKWKLVVLNIWEATWEDVEYVRDIVCS